MKKKITSFKPGEVWLDVDGVPIQAHGGGILYKDGVYYWYGENRTGGGPRAVGISCYSSTDLYNWKHEGVVLTRVLDDPNHDLAVGKVLERPKVIYNEKTGKYVMWMHIDSPDYSYARAGVAVSDKPTGPFEYIGSYRPVGAMSRDMTVFKDDDGKAYLIFSSENNSTMYVALLTEDYLKPEGTYTRNFENRWREAPAIFKHDGKYYLITSGCTGWDPNEAEYAVADSPLGPWKVMGNPCKGENADKTFFSQSTYVLPVADKPGAYIFMADRWKKNNLGDSRYIWLPIFIENGNLSIFWMDEWDLSIFDKNTKK
ncbi:MAG TPA: glycoside hydrolase family 43 protein [Tissierellaceae bacterium]